MPKTTVITGRVDPELKQDTEQVLKQLGLTPSQAITLFYRQITLRQGLPFPVNLPNQKTQRALQEAQGRRKLKSFRDVDELFEDLEA